MAALTTSRNTLERGRNIIVAPVAANVKIHGGALTALNASGLAVPGTVAANLRSAGRAQVTADNTGGAAGVISVEIKRGVFRFKNHGADPVVQADVLADCYIVDDQTVAKTSASNTRSRAGTVLEIDGESVWVEIG